jgi:hypothetical protein
MLLYIIRLFCRILFVSEALFCVCVCAGKTLKIKRLAKFMCIIKEFVRTCSSIACFCPL